MRQRDLVLHHNSLGSDSERLLLTPDFTLVLATTITEEEINSEMVLSPLS